MGIWRYPNTCIHTQLGLGQTLGFLLKTLGILDLAASTVNDLAATRDKGMHKLVYFF